jgi:hypothetical protein
MSTAPTKYLYNQLTSKLVSVITSQHGPRRKHRFKEFSYCCAWTRCRGNLFVSWSLSSNGSACCIAPSLRQFFPKRLPANCHFFFPEGCVWWGPWSVSPSFPYSRFSRKLLYNRSHCSLFKATGFELFSHKAPVGPALLKSSFLGRCGQNYLDWLAPLHLRLLLCVQSLLSFRRVSTPPQCPITHFPQSNESSVNILRDLQLYGLPDVLSIRYSCSFKSRSLIPLLPSWRIRCRLSSVRLHGNDCIKIKPIVTSYWER